MRARNVEAAPEVVRPVSPTPRSGEKRQQTLVLVVVMLGVMIVAIDTTIVILGMANAPRQAYGLAWGLLRTRANVGMVGSFAVALVSAAAAIPRQIAFAIFFGTSTLTPALGAAFVHGRHVALLVEIVPMLIAVALSTLRGREARSQVRPIPLPSGHRFDNARLLTLS